MARALVARGPVRALNALGAVRGFGRRRRTYLRYALARPTLEATVSELLYTLTDTPPDVPPVVVAHPLGPDATFPARVAERLMLFHHDTPDAPVVPGFPADHPRILGPRAALRLPAPPRQAVILGGGYVAVEIGLHWAEQGCRVAFIHDQRALLSAFVPAFAAPIRAELAERHATVLINAEVSGWTQRGELLVVYAETWEGRVAVVGDLILLAPGW